MFKAKAASRCGVPLLSLAAALLMLAIPPPAAAQTACADSIQGRIAWDGAKNTSWTAANLGALCKGAETSTEPGKCFKRVKSGSVDFGGGTNWNPDNALRLCAGALDASARVSCFEGKIAEGIKWAAAISQCQGTGTPALQAVSVSKGSVPAVKPGGSAVKVPPATSTPKTASTPPARPAPTCPGGDCDGDGVSLAAGDCDDGDAARYPGATEIADFAGYDEDCNPTTYGELDVDGDGFTDARVCNGPTCGQDCDDTRPAVNPHAAELPNRRDDNCNGLIDDDLEGWWNPAP